MTIQEGIGTATKRREDVRFLRGKGNYTDDMNRPGQSHVVFLRSQVAHGVVRSIDCSEAEAMVRTRVGEENLCTAGASLADRSDAPLPCKVGVLFKTNLSQATSLPNSICPLVHTCIRAG